MRIKQVILGILVIFLFLLVSTMASALPSVIIIPKTYLPINVTTNTTITYVNATYMSMDNTNLAYLNQSNTGDINVTGTAKASQFCIGASCVTSWASGIYYDLAINNTITSINLTDNMLALGLALNSTFLQYAMNSSLSQYNNYNWTTLSAGLLGLNETFSQYNTWNVNQTALSIGWVEAQGYLTTGSTAISSPLTYTGTEVRLNNTFVSMNVSNNLYVNGSTIWTGRNDFIITPFGNVGIGTVSPNAPLDIRGVGVVGGAIDIINTGTALTNVGGLTLSSSQPTVNNYIGILFADNIGAVSDASGHIGMQLTDRDNHYGDISFATRFAGGYTEKMRIMSGGNIGIGTSQPSHNLTVAGDTNITGLLGLGDITPTSRLMVSGDINASGGMSATQFCIGASCTTSWASNPYDDTSLNATIYAISQSNTTTWLMAKSINTTNNALALGLALNSTFVQYGLNSTFAQYDDYNRNWTTLSYNLFALNSSLLQVPLNATFLQYDTNNRNWSALSIGWVEAQGYLTTGVSGISSPFTYTGTEVRLNNTFLSLNVSNQMIVNSTGVHIGGIKGTSGHLIINSTADRESLIINAGGISGAVAFLLNQLPLSTTTSNGKAFGFQIGGETFSRGIFYSDGSYGVGSGSATRDVYISRSAVNTLRIDSDRASGSANLHVTGNIINPTLQTISASNTTTWDMAKSINVTNNFLIGHGLALNSTFLQYAMNSSLSQYNNYNWTTLSAGLLGLNETFSQYNTWNVNQTALSIGWVEAQGYLTTGSTAISSPLIYSEDWVMLNNSFTSLNISDRIFISPTNVSIGTNSGNQVFVVQGTANITGGAGKEGLFIDSDGQVGLGTSAPDVALHIKSLVDGYTEMKMDGTGLAGGGQWTIGTAYSGEGNLVDNFYWYYNTAPDNELKMIMTPKGHLGLGILAPNSTLEVAGDINASGGMSATQFCIGASCTTSWASNPYDDTSLNATIYAISQSNTTTWLMAKSINTTNNALALGLALNSTFVQYGLNSTFAQYDVFNRNFTALSQNLFALNSSLNQVPLNSTFLQYAMNISLLQYLSIVNAPISSPLTYTGTEVRMNNTFVSMNVSNSLFVNSTAVKVNSNINLTILQDVLIGSTNQKGKIRYNGSCTEIYGLSGVMHIC